MAHDTPVLVDIHLRAFPGFFLSVLGAQFLRRLYLEILEDETGVVLIYADESGVRGFVAGSFSPVGLYGRLVRKRWLRFALASIAPALRRPWIAFRLFRALRKPASEQNATQAALLMSLAVAPESQGRKIGRALTTAFCRVCFAHGFSKVKLTTDTIENEAVNAFYRGQGFSVIRTFTTSEGREMNEYVRELTESSLS